MPEREGVRAEVRRTIAAGELAGTTDGAVERYLGIPFAAEVAGERRFAPPEPVEPWAGVRDATRPGPTPPQAPYAGGLETVLPSIVVEGDAILNLNISAPVVVWIYGGALSRGANALDVYDGSAFAGDGVVFVAVNYRVGVEGFSVLDGGPLNVGLLDQLAALRWVREEIAAFGGDPGRVTVAGQSAGANSIAALLASPRASGLFARAILQSGPLTALPPRKAGRITRLIAKDLGIRPARADFLARPAEELVEAQKRVTAGTTPLTGGPGYALAIDGALVPRDPAEAFADGAADGVPVLIGATSEEYRLWMVPTGLLDRIGAVHLAAARLKFRISGRTVRRYRANRPGARTSEVFGALATDLLLRVPLNRLADGRRARGAARTWVYEFDWPSPVRELGAAHCMELGFVFDRLDAARALSGDTAPQALADEMHAAWVAFIRDGDPGWEPWDEHRPVRAFGDGGGRTLLAPREEERAALAGA